MARSRVIHNNFTAGELTARLRGRTDLAKYFNGADVLTNFLIYPQGGVTRRPGTRFVAEVKDSTKKSVIISFTFSVTQSYALEFGNLSMRVYRNGGQVLETAKTITGATQANPVVVTSSSHGFSNGDEVVIAGVVGMTELNGLSYRVKNVAANTFELTDLTDANINGTAFTAYTSGGTAARVFTLVTPYLEAELFELKMAQSADVLYVAHPKHAQRKITRTADDAWTITQITFLDGPYFKEEATPTITPSAVTGSGITLTASAALFKADHVGALWRIKHDLTPGTSTVTPQGASGSTAYSYRITALNKNGETLPGTAGTTSTGNATLDGTNFNRVTWTSIPGAIAYRVYGRKANVELFIAEVQATTYDDGPAPAFSPNGALPITDKSLGHWGYVTIATFSSSTSVTADVKVDLGRTNASIAQREGAWSTEQGFPGAVALFGSALWWAGSTQRPQTIWRSVVGDFENHDEGVGDDDEAIVVTIASNEVNAIRWLSPIRQLLAGTVGAEFVISGPEDDVITPSNIDARSESVHGSANIQPVRVGNSTVFIQLAGKKVRSFVISFAADATGAFVAPDLTILAESITGTGLTDLSYQQEPNSVIYAVRKDGDLLALTYLIDQDVVGWARFTTDGNFESVATIPHPNKDRDQVWVIVKRTINGVTKRYVEYFEDVPSEFTARDWKEFYSDSALPYSGSAITVVTGLEHLEGKTVRVIGDGAVYPDATVANGQITISPAATEIEVGLNYDSKLVTVSPEIPALGTVLSKRQHWNQIAVLLENSLGVTIFGDVVSFRKSSDPMDAAPPLFSGFKKTTHQGIDDTGRITIEQTQPLPLTILAVIGDLNIGEV